MIFPALTVKKMAGQEGFEPPSPGFGIRCSSRWSYWPNLPLLRFFVGCVGMAESAVLLELQFFRRRPLIFSRCIISSLALTAFECNNISHRFSSLLCELCCLYYSITSETTPAPTVRPPSRIANRNSFSRAIGVINSPTSSTLSPGITISTPSGNVARPVTSVVLK